MGITVYVSEVAVGSVKLPVPFDFFRLQFSFDSGWTTCYQCARRDNGSLGNNRTCGHERLLADYCAVKHKGSHSYYS